MITGRVVMSSCSFTKVTTDPANETAPDEHGERDRGEVDRRPATSSRVETGQLEQRDQGGGAAADAVEQGDQLRHLRHLHPPGGGDGDRRADRDRDEDRQQVLQVRRRRT